MRKLSGKFLFVLVALILIASMGLSACGSESQKPLPPITYEGDGCDAVSFPLGKEREIAQGVTVSIDWSDRFVRDNTSISGWVVAINENGARRVLAFGEALVYSSQPGEGWAQKPVNKTMQLSVTDQKGIKYTFASVYTDTLELHLACEPLVEQPGTGSLPVPDNAPEAPAGYCAYAYDSTAPTAIQTPFGMGTISYGEYEIHYTITQGGQVFEEFAFASISGQWHVKYSGTGGEFVSIGDTFTFTDSTTGLLVLFFETESMTITVYGQCSAGSVDA